MNVIGDAQIQLSQDFFFVVYTLVSNHLGESGVVQLAQALLNRVVVEQLSLKQPAVSNPQSRFSVPNRRLETGSNSGSFQ